MQVCKAFYKVTLKQFKSISLYFIIFAVLTIMLTNMGQKQIESGFQQEEIKLSVIDRSHSNSSRALTEYLDKTQKLVSLKDDKATWADELFFRNTEYILIIPEDFEEKLAAGENELLSNYKLPNSISGNYIDNQLNQFLSTVSAYLKAGYSYDDAFTKAEETLAVSGEVTMLGQQKSDQTSQPAHYYFFQYLPYIFICMIINGLGPVLVIFRKKELKDRMNCSCLSLTSKNVQLIAGSLLFSLFIWLLFMILGVITYSDILFTKEWNLLMLNSIVFMMLTICLTYLICHFAKNYNILNLVSNVIGLGSSFLCGVFVPLNMLSDKVVSIGKFLPAYWYIKAMEYVKTDNMTKYLNCLFVQLFFMAAFFCCALVISKSQQKEQ